MPMQSVIQRLGDLLFNTWVVKLEGQMYAWVIKLEKCEHFDSGLVDSQTSKMDHITIYDQLWDLWIKEL